MKKIFSAFLLMTMMVASVGSFVSCSDIEDAIAKVETSANANAADIEALQSEVAALKTALATAQADAAAAKEAANAAKEAAATAKAEAIAAALAEIEKVNGDVKKMQDAIDTINAALEGKADMATVKLLQDTMDKYSALTDENAKAVEAIKAQLAALEAAGVTAENFAKVVADMKKIDAALVSFAQAVAGQIQSIVYVPVSTENELTATRYTLGTGGAATNFIIPATFEVKPAALAATLTSENTFFTSVDVVTKAAAAQVVPVQILNADPETGRVDLIAVLSDKANTTKDDYDVLIATGKTLSFALCVSDENNVKVGEEEVDLGTYTSSEFIPVAKPGAPIDVYSKIGLLSYDVYGAPIMVKDFEQYPTAYMPYNTPLAESKVNLFDTQIVVDFMGMIVDPATASAVLGKNLDVQYKAQDDITVTFTKGTTTIAKDKAPIKVTGTDLTATAELVAAKDYKDEKAIGVVATMTINSGWRVNGEPLAITATSTYQIINKQADAAIVVESYTNDWTYTDGTVWAYNSAVTNAKDIQLDVNTPIDLTGKTFDMYTYIPNVGYTSVTVKGISSKVVKLMEVDNLPYTKGKATTYQFQSMEPITVSNTDYYAAFNVTLNAMPTDKVIDLGTKQVVGSTDNEMTVAVAPLDAILATDASFYPKFKKENFTDVTDPAASAVKVKINGYEKDPYTYEAYGKDDAYVSVKTGLNKDGKTVEDHSQVVIAAASKFDDVYEISQVYNFAGVKYTIKVKVELTKPSYSLTYDEMYVDPATGVVELGSGALPKIGTNGETTAQGTNFTLGHVDLRNYVKVVGMTDKTIKSEFAIKYKLLTKKQKKDDAEVGVLPTAKATTAVTGESNVVTWNSEYTEMEYEISLISSTNADEVFGTPVKVKLVIPQLVKFGESTVVKGSYTVDADATKNLVASIVVKDFKGNNAYNPVAADMSEIWTGTKATTKLAADGKTQVFDKLVTDSAKANWYGVYGQAVTYDASKVKIYHNGTEIDKAEVKYTIDPSNGNVTLSRDNGNLRGTVRFEIPVTLTYWFDNYELNSPKTNAIVEFVAE